MTRLRDPGPSRKGQARDNGPGSATALLALILNHQRQRWRRGERVPVETYLDQEPSLRADAEAVLDLIYHEIILREEVGESPQLDDYLARFPDLAPQLRLQFEVESAIRPSPLLKQGDSVSSPDEVPPSSAAEGRRTVADYEILGELGHGGMGVVYKARQIRLNRVVALKMILAGDHASPEVAARFLAEAEAVAQLRHPNIVRVYASGDHDGRPYFAMEYVAGGSLADRLDGTPRPARVAAELVVTLARAMSAAHRLGIVHRDLKPANILLDEDGTPKIADFGLAKCLRDDSGRTRTRAIVGSPSYMAPEQAGGSPADVSPATDVYSLGAILYELLTGRPPFLGETPLATLEQVRDREPVPPSRLLKNIPRDLETICLKCLHKDPSSRFADTNVLAEDLDRFLAGKPILARPVSLAERLWRACRRQPVLAGLAACLVLATVGGWVGIVTQWRRAEVHLKEARRQSELAETNYFLQVGSNLALRRANEREASARGRAQERFDAAMKALRVFEAATNDAQLVREPKMEGVRTKMLQASLGFYRELQASLEEDASRGARSQLAQAYQRAARITAGLGWYDESLAIHQRSLTLVEQMAAEAPSDPDLRNALANCHVEIGILLNTVWRHTEALESFEQARALQEALVRERPQDRRRREQLSWTLGNIGVSYGDMGRLNEAVAMHSQVLEIREELLAMEPGNGRYRSNLAWCLYDLGLAYEGAREMGEALRLIERAATIQQEVVERDPTHVEHRRRLAWCLDSIGRIRLDLGRVGEAAGPLERAAEYRETLVREHPAYFRDDLGLSLIRIARHRIAARSRGEAWDYLQRADSLLHSSSIGRPVTLYNLACTHCLFLGLLANDPAVSAQEREAQEGLTLVRLRQAIASGYKDVAHMNRDPDFDPIRANREFRLLLMDLAFPVDPFARGDDRPLRSLTLPPLDSNP